MVVRITDAGKLERIRIASEYLFHDEEIERIMQRANEESVKAVQVFHGYPHALDVRRSTRCIIEGIERVIPGYFGPFVQDNGGMVGSYLQYVAESAAMLHDVGRAFGVLPWVSATDTRNHAVSGAKFSAEYLRRLSLKLFGSEDALSPLFQGRVAYDVRNHRAEMWLGKYRRRRFNGPDTTAMIIGDKLSGSENKVPEQLLNMMYTIANIPVPPELRTKYQLDDQWTLARINWNNPQDLHEPAALIDACAEILAAEGITIPDELLVDDHFRINGAIKDRNITIFADEVPSEPHFKGTLLCQLTVDERLAPRTLVTGEREWWNDAWHVVSLATGYMHLRLLLEFNGEVFQYNKALRDWTPALSFKA